MYMYSETTSVSSDAVLHVVDIVTYMYMYTETASVSSDAVLSRYCDLTETTSTQC